MFCPECGKEVAEDQMFCQYCGTRLREQEAGAAPKETLSEAAASEESKRTAWEDREARGFFKGLFRTMNDALFRPTEFFRNMPVTGGLTDPLLYALIVGMTGFMFSYLWQILTRGSMENMMPGMQGQHLLHGVGLTVTAFLSPFLVIIGLFVSAGILHLCLLMVKGAHAGFEATFRVASYSYSANVFLIIPFCGSLLAIVWSIVLSIIGLREAHKTTGGKAAFAVFFPVILCCGLTAFAVALFLGAAAGSLGLMMHMQK